jgi:hypothetical protein
MTGEFEELYNSAFGRLVGQLLLVTGDLHEAEEVVQEAYMRAAGSGCATTTCWRSGSGGVAINLATNERRLACWHGWTRITPQWFAPSRWMAWPWLRVGPDQGSGQRPIGLAVGCGDDPAHDGHRRDHGDDDEPTGTSLVVPEAVSSHRPDAVVEPGGPG